MIFTSQTYLPGRMGAIAIAGMLFCVSSTLQAGPLKSATVSALHNEVIINKDGANERPAVARDVVAGRDTLRTGKKSRAELEFADKSIARLGSNTVFSFDPESRRMKLDRGTALIHVPPGLSGAKISTPAATAAIQGDVVAMRVNAQGATQIVALSRDAQGPVTVTFNRTGESRTLDAGQMLTISPTDLQLPQAVSISVDAFIQSSTLVRGDQGFSEQLPQSARQEIRQAESIQQKEIQSGMLDSGGGLAVKPDALAGSTSMISSESVAVQSAAGNRLAGRYVGIYRDLPPNIETGSLTFMVTEDGTLTGSGIGNVGNDPFSFRGTVSNDGSFQLVDDKGKPGNGALSLTGASFSGTVNHPSNGGSVPAVLEGTKQ